MIDYSYGVECGMGGTVLGAVYHDGRLICDCCNDPLIYRDQVRCVFQMHLPGWNVHGIHPRIICYDGRTATAWICHRVTTYGKLRVDAHPYARFQPLLGNAPEERFDITMRQDRAVPIQLHGGPACAACSEQIARFKLTECELCRHKNTMMWEAALDLLDKP